MSLHPQNTHVCATLAQVKISLKNKNSPNVMAQYERGFLYITCHHQIFPRGNPPNNK